MNELVPGGHGGAIIPTSSELQTMLQFADALFKSGLLPDSIKSPQSAFAIIQKGRELGIPAMYALSNINVIKGKPTCSSELMSALIYRDHGDNGLRVIEQTEQVCTVEYKRRTWKEAGRYSFTWDMATKAGLTNSDTYRKFPGTMLMRRAVSNIAKRDFSDSIGGLYLPEELGAEVAVDGEGTVTVVQEHAALNHDHSERDDVIAETGEIVEEPSVYKPASANQVSTAVKLTRLLGRAYEPTGEETAAEISDLIADLSEEYNERKSGRPIAPAADGTPSSTTGITSGQKAAITKLAPQVGDKVAENLAEWSFLEAAAYITSLQERLDARKKVTA